jgi:hypothetical protein
MDPGNSDREDREARGDRLQRIVDRIDDQLFRRVGLGEFRLAKGE